MSNQIHVVHLTLIKGGKILKDEDGKIANETLSYKLIKESVQWGLDLKNFKHLGFSRATVDKVIIIAGGKEIGEASTEFTAAIQEELTNAILTKQASSKSAQDVKIEEMQATIEKLVAAQSKQTVKENSFETKVAEKPDIDPELKQAREDYFALAGKKGSPKWTVEDIKAKIEELSK